MWLAFFCDFLSTFLPLHVSNVEPSHLTTPDVVDGDDASITIAHKDWKLLAEVPVHFEKFQDSKANQCNAVQDVKLRC